MQNQEACTRLEPGPAVAVESADPPVPARGVRPVDAWFLDGMLERAERRGEAIRARSEWIDARRRELWERMDRLRGRTDPATAAPAGASVAGPSAGRPADILRGPAERIEIRVGIVSGEEPGTGDEGAPGPEPVAEAGAAL